jgi:hypothetical protein
LLKEQNEKLDKLFNEYISSLNENNDIKKETKYNRAEIYDSDSLLVNEEFDKMIDALGKFTEENK